MEIEDKKLLEFAAKACGYEILDWYGEKHACLDTNTNKQLGWNPLKDDGDAFRLSVQLDLMCSHKRFIKQKIAIVDPFYATRLAIVMAASEIGEKNGD